MSTTLTVLDYLTAAIPMEWTSGMSPGPAPGFTSRRAHPVYTAVEGELKIVVHENEASYDVHVFASFADSLATTTYPDEVPHMIRQCFGAMIDGETDGRWTPEQIVEGIPPWARRGALEYARVQMDREHDLERRIQALILKPLEDEQSKRGAVCDLLTERLP